MITQENKANGEESGKRSSEQKGKNQENILQSKQGRIRETHSTKQTVKTQEKFLQSEL
jgi:hypothetical protein